MSQWGEWEHIPDDQKFETYKMKVPGGWLIRTVEVGYHNRHTTVTFVPEIKE